MIADILFVAFYLIFLPGLAILAALLAVRYELKAQAAEQQRRKEASHGRA